MRGLSELVFSTTNTCNAKCRDCPIIPSVQEPMRLELDAMKRIVDEVHGWGSLRLVVFTGGESFLLGADLEEIIRYVASKEVMTRVVTNAYWAKTPARAKTVLGRLKEAGLTEINISCDDYHQEFIPLERVKNANAAAADLEIPALLVHRRKRGGELTVARLAERLGVDLEIWRKGRPNPTNNVVCSSRNIPLEPDECAESVTARAEYPSSDRNWRGPCTSVLKGIIVFPDLSVQICCGIAKNWIPELKIGSLRESTLLPILEAGNRDLIANWLALEGPSSVLDFVREKMPEIDLPTRFVGRCHVCNVLFSNPDVRQVLQAHAAEKLSALTMMRGALDWATDDWPGSPEKTEANDIAEEPSHAYL